MVKRMKLCFVAAIVGIGLLFASCSNSALDDWTTPASEEQSQEADDSESFRFAGLHGKGEDGGSTHTAPATNAHKGSSSKSSGR